MLLVCLLFVSGLRRQFSEFLAGTTGSVAIENMPRIAVLAYCRLGNARRAAVVAIIATRRVTNITQC